MSAQEYIDRARKHNGYTFVVTEYYVTKGLIAIFLQRPDLYFKLLYAASENEDGTYEWVAVVGTEDEIKSELERLMSL